MSLGSAEQKCVAKTGLSGRHGWLSVIMHIRSHTLIVHLLCSRHFLRCLGYISEQKEKEKRSVLGNLIL